MLTDTHCHILLNEYEDRDIIIENLTKNKIKRIIINGYDLESNKEVIFLTKKYKNVYGAIGIHPNYVSSNNLESIKFIKENISNPKILAVGEIGLDFYRTNDNKNKQIEIFEKMMQIAEDNNKPVIIHNRNSTEEILNIVKKYNVRGIFHSFSGSLDTAKRIIKLGYKLGINGIVTFKNTNLRQVLKELDIKDILLETDSPYISPEPLRGKRNEPKNLIFILETISNTYGLSKDKLTIQLEENFLSIFDIKK